MLSNVPDNAKMLNEEIFGPVASLQTFKDEAEVIKRANDTEYGLVAYLYTKDLGRGMRVSEKLDFGMIGLEPRPRLRSGGAVRRHEAVRHRPRRRARGAEGVSGDAVHLGELVRARKVLQWTS